MPTGRHRIPAVPSTVPPEPPAEMIPPISRWRLIQLSKATAMAATDFPRSPAKTVPAPRGWALATSLGETSALDGLPEVDTSTVRVCTPTERKASRTNFSSRAFVSKVPTTRATVPTVWRPTVSKTVERGIGSASAGSVATARMLRPISSSDRAQRFGSDRTAW